MSTVEWAALVAVVVLAALHMAAGGMRFLAGTPRSRVLSAAGGISVAYVFVHLLPEIARGSETIEEAAEGTAPFLEEHAFLIALLGLAVFYGLERRTSASSGRHQDGQETEETDAATFWVSMASFAVYNALVGYLLLHREEDGLVQLALFAVALGLHFLVNDYGLREDHGDDYDRVGRWVLAGAILVGWGIGMATSISEAAIAVLLAFLGGGIVLNVLKEELPAERQSRFSAFALGTLVYATLLVAAA
jgi:hypothetical protein